MNKRLFYSSIHHVSDKNKQNVDKLLLIYSKSNKRRDNRHFPIYQSGALGKLYKINDSLMLPLINEKSNYPIKKKSDQLKNDILDSTKALLENQITNLPQINQDTQLANEKNHTLSNQNIKQKHIYKSNTILQDITNICEPGNQPENENQAKELNNNKSAEAIDEKQKFKRPLFRKKKSWNLNSLGDLKQKRFPKQIVLQDSATKTMNYVDPELRSCDLIFRSNEQSVLEYIRVNELLPESKLKDIQRWLEDVNSKENVDVNRFTYNSKIQWFEYL